MPLIKWAQKLGDHDCPYMTRWVLDLKLCSLRLHHFHRSDSDRHLHDHPWWFVSVILSPQGYDEVTEATPEEAAKMPPSLRAMGMKIERCRPWRPNFRRAKHRHAVRLIDEKPVWTVCFTGPVSRPWGFWVDKVFKASREYFGIYGHPPCE